MCRIEWRPLKPHDNKGLGPEEFRMRKITESHIHPFDLNWEHSPPQVRRGNLPIAVPICEAIDSYEEALAFVEKEFRIKGVVGLPAPPWETRLLW